MRFTEIDLQIEDIMWFGVDNNGYIFECTSGGFGHVPEFVCQSKEDTEALCNFFLEELPITTEAKLICPDENNQLMIDAKLLTQKGIFCFDVTTQKKRDYQKLTEPIKPIHINNLPEKIRKLLQNHKISIDLPQITNFDIKHAY